MEQSSREPQYTQLKPLDKLEKGEMILYGQDEWFVKEKELFKESETYSETQWTVVSRKQGECYLMMSKEIKNNETEVIWVFTRPTNLVAVEHQRGENSWVPFREIDFPGTAPKTVKYEGKLFTFDGETSCQARDDEGMTVTKITWDYYDDKRKQNLAIEIWKEPDRDYPEAYDGKVILGSMVKILPKKLQNRRAPASFDVKNVWTILGWSIFLLFIVFTMGVPLDCIIGYSVPVIAFFAAIALYGKLGWLILSSIITWIAVIGFAVYFKFNLNFIHVSIFSILAATASARLCAQFGPEDERCHYSAVSFSGLFPIVWACSFIVYFKYAPGPHSFGQLFITSLLPVVPAVICYLINLGLERFEGGTQT